MVIRLMRKVEVETASSQNFSGRETFFSKVNVVSIKCMCFLSAVPFCSGVLGQEIL